MPDPIIFSWGFLTIRWYGLLIASAMLIGIIIALRQVKQRNWNEEHFLNMVLVMIPASVLGARLYYVFFNWEDYRLTPGKILATWEGGLAIHGALIVGFLVVWLMSRHYGFGLANVLDVISPSVVLGQAIGRWGNYFNQEAYGYPVDPANVPWAMFIDGAYRHPTFLYESIWDLLIFLFLMFWLSRRPWKLPGDVGLGYIMLYSLGRFVIEGFRTDSLMILGILRAAQVVSAIAFLVAAVIFWWRHRKKPDGGRIYSVR
jgi:phosphatidylglycerol:prolipoprotein diacylglycerol transferase